LLKSFEFFNNLLMARGVSPLRSRLAADILDGMRREAYAILDSIRKEFRGLVAAWSSDNPFLLEAQERVRAKQGYDDYRVETPIVYNRALDDIGPESEIKVILVADNPGKKEQLASNNRYLVGQSGKLAEGWFQRELGIDFRREVLILNKTPVHTPKTAELAILARSAGLHRQRLEALLAGSQAAMADLAWRLYGALRQADASGGTAGLPLLWISGVGELRKGGLFEIYRDELGRRLAKAAPELRSGVLAFNHFSMNQFAVEIKRKIRPRLPIAEELMRIGRENRIRVFGS
jgi:hypothetical protein